MNLTLWMLVIPYAEPCYEWDICLFLSFNFFLKIAIGFLSFFFVVVTSWIILLFSTSIVFFSRPIVVRVVL